MRHPNDIPESDRTSGVLGTVLGAGLLIRFGPIMDTTRVPSIARAALLLAGPLILYTLALLDVFLRKRDLVIQRARNYWAERLNAVLEDRAPDPSFKDIPDLAAWMHAGFCHSTYAIGRWEVEDGL